jgi:hypothetical protein
MQKCVTVERQVDIEVRLFVADRYRGWQFVSRNGTSKTGDHDPEDARLRDVEKQAFHGSGEH